MYVWVYVYYNGTCICVSAACVFCISTGFCTWIRAVLSGLGATMAWSER